MNVVDALLEMDNILVAGPADTEVNQVRYQRTDFAVDTDKFWLTVNMAFQLLVLICNAVTVMRSL